MQIEFVSFDKKRANIKKLKAIIKTVYYELLKEYNLPDIPISFDKRYSVAFYYSFSTNERKLFFNLNEMIYLLSLRDRKRILFNRAYKLNSVRKRLYFIIGHELGHYYHNYKCHSNYRACNKKDKIIKYFNPRMSQANYRKLYTEKKADKLSRALMNRVLNKGLK